MVDEAQVVETTEEAPKPQLTPEQQYLQGLLDKFNANAEDPTLTHAQRALLGQVRAVTQELSQLFVQADEVNKEIQEGNSKLQNLQQQVLLKRGQSQGLVDALLALREE